MARGKKKHRPANKKKAATPTSETTASTSATDDAEMESNANALETKQELTTEQELALEAKEERRQEKLAKNAERTRKKKEKEEIAAMPGPKQVTLRHVLIKHAQARNSFSKRTLTQVNTTKNEATAELKQMLVQLEDTETSELERVFSTMALERSDCGTHVTGGKLDIQRRQMHVNFEKVAWSLEVGTLAPDVIETESGCHIVMRVG